MLHEALIGEADEVEFLNLLLAVIADPLTNAVYRFHFLEFISAWARRGKPLPSALLERLVKFVRELPETPARTACLAELDKSLNYFSPVLGR